MAYQTAREGFYVDFSFTEEQLMIQDVARRIAQERIAPSAEHHDRTGEFPLENIRLLGENGLMGIEVPEEYGGAGMDPIAYVLAMVEIAAGDAAHSTIVSVNNSLFCAGILKNGDEAQKQKYVRAIADGSHIGAFALTEPQSGSDATAMRCRAVRQDDGSFVINGKKSWITSGPVAKYLVLFAVTDPEQGSRGITAFVIDTDKPGFHRGKTEPKLGIRASATCEIEFQDYVASADEVLGVPGEGFKIAMSVLDAGRIGIASQAIGIARAAYQATLDYVKERKAFGSPIGAFQMTQAKIADMKCKLDASLLLTLRAAWVKGQGQRFTTEAAVAKLTASEAAMWITHQAVQIHGGMGYSKEMPLERYFRDAKITEIYEGTSEIQRLVIARNETGLR
ncbi:acyl-CoA dehydrogenase family protein [Xanthomonas translucens]|uniref:3-sulfinopropanoyl-CoA desulfinase n=2 Tax=Xanthomonas translucens pv. translucens TaxID=134875 RepID=A0A1C3TMY7_XANCT|nr:acyl-CoA dehydrogenase family protein [Xanthomonas translucens]MCC8448227.1 acyl-CoA dehydrogenase family protein [Xanthomonas translucens pv. translucens]MCS3374645.1 acyl-CoA dehydrogenase family protein [Xanthomonas translucens pv. translucens]MCT8290347.1 acyl-CoA dehydrogenase family protein [Xanthomonas translucens pv. translucens]MCT8294070.1 acyl-CoA dehydrogenase family protein [Xanthomonas translucens pv. translucens]MCT8308312.1 acyl-CoA dehydrogenase family protein [Xanthomonas 